MSSNVTVFDGQLIVGESEVQEEPNEKVQSVIDWLAEDDAED